MSKRRCCCGGSTEPGAIPCPECPDPVSPCAAPQYRIELSVGNILPDSAGKGALQVSTHVLDCMRGTCGRTEYRRKALALSVLSLGVCEVGDMCDAMVDQAGPYADGKHNIEWAGCNSPFLPQQDPPDPATVEDIQTGAVTITEVYSQLYWNPATCFWTNAVPPGIANDCRSYVRVEFTYTDSFTYKFFDDFGPPDPCQSIDQTFTFTRTWVCYYSRRNGAGQYTALGTYRLVRCEYPPAVNTLAPTGGSTAPCTLGGGVVCAADGLTYIGSIPTLWQPPASITVTRTC